jgi:protein-S-isoprenylcysteine O-methyltransferase Ste14
VSTFLFRHRDRLLSAWGAGFLVLAWPPRGFGASLVLLIAGGALRLWARAHIGPHSRGRNLSAPVRCAGGPYALLPHPLYVANLLVIAALALQVAGPSVAAGAALAGPALLYAALARAESRHLRATSPPVRTEALPWSQRRMASEWASLLPPAGLWVLFWMLAP